MTKYNNLQHLGKRLFLACFALSLFLGTMGEMAETSPSGRFAVFAVKIIMANTAVPSSGYAYLPAHRKTA